MDSHANTLYFYGKHETQSAKSEADLQKHFTECVKNPGHKDFIPYEEFTIQHVPGGNQHLYELIKLSADLTVRINVENSISEHRPEFIPETLHPYPYYNQSGETDKTRTGSGAVYEVICYEDGVGITRSGQQKSGKENTCPCHMCQQKTHQERSRKWWVILVRTAHHVVFDKIEAKHTSLRLFFNSQSSPKVVLENIEFDHGQSQQDWCILKHITCTMNDLADNLFDLVKRRHELLKKVEDEFKNSQDKYVFIVSHPHGCHKQVSMGKMTSSVPHPSTNKDFDMNLITYDASTCPGSSGAQVRSIGYRWGHVHSGSEGDGQNYSGVSLVPKVV